MYQKILDEAIRDLKRKKFKDLFKQEIQAQDDFVSDCTIDTDLEILIPDTYVDNIAERLSLYTRLDNSENEEELQEFHTEMQDRFGPIPRRWKTFSARYAPAKWRWTSVLKNAAERQPAEMPFCSQPRIALFPERNL